MERRSERSDSPRSETIVDARISLALWLRAGRVQRGMSLDDVAKITKIQSRILERLEAGKLEGLPADVFVRGFVRSFARCVGLDDEEALRRYAACGLGGLSGSTGPTGSTRSVGASGSAGASSSDITPSARALVEAMADLVPGSATVARATAPRMLAVEVIDLPLPLPAGSLLPAGSPRDLPAAGALVETMMLPETGTVVVPAQLTTSLAEAMTDSDLIAEASAGAPATSQPAASPPDALQAGPVEPDPVALLHVDHDAAEPTSAEPARKKRGRRGKGRHKRTGGGAAPAFLRDLSVVGTPAEASLIVAPPVAPGVPDIAKARGSAVITAVSAAPVGSEALAASLIAPSTDAPSTDAPSTDAPSTDAPSTDAPSTNAPSTNAPSTNAPSIEPSIDASSDQSAIDEPIATATWAPKMPPIAATPSVPWRRPAYVASAAVVVPSLVIDDADPDSAERVLEERAEKHTPRRSFLPPILLDREDRSARQGGLTLAVIILLIAATLTLSYLMRRPSAGGDGMTRLETPASTIELSDGASPARG